MRSSATPRSYARSQASTLALLAAMSLVSSLEATTFYKADNTTSPTSAGSWWLNADGTGVPVSDGNAATDADVPTNTTAATSICIWNNLVTGAQTLPFPNVGMHTIRILNPGGPITLNGTNGQTLTTGATGGGIDMSQATQDLTLLNCFFRIPNSGNTVGLQVATGRTLTFGTAAQVNVRSNSGGTTLNINTDGVSTGTVTFAANVYAANVVVGAGHVELNNPSGNSKNNASNSSTTIGGGASPARLLINNTSGSATGLPNPGATPTPITSTVTVNANGTLGGNGISASTVTANAGSVLSPGVSTVNTGIGSLSLASLTLTADSSILWEANNTADADLLSVTASNGLTVNGGTIFLYNPGTTDPLTAVGTFNLINCSGAIGGTGLGALTIAESTKIAGRNYTLGLGGSGITLTITTGTIIQRSWDVDASGTWSTDTNWTADTIPDAIGTIARITGSAGATFTAPRTVTLDSTRTVGTLDLDSAQPVTVAGSATLTLNNDLAAATLNATGASHVVSTPLALTPGGVLASVESPQLTLSGAVSGTGAGIVKTGSGTLLLTADNPYTGNTSVSAGILQVGDGGTAGSVGGPIANNGTVRFNRSDSLVLALPISGSGGVEFTGGGETTLQAANTFSGATTLSAGSLVLANDLALQNSTLTYSSTGGSLTVLDPVVSVTLGGLAGNRAFPLTNTLGTALALTVGGNNSTTTYSASPLGTGASFTKSGTGTLTLTGTHTYSGNTLVNAGTLSIDAGSTFNTAAANLGAGATARILVNGGILNSSASSIVTNASVGLAVADGTANFTGGLTTDAGSSTAESFINVTGGTLNAASISLSRGTLNLGTEPTSGQTNQGLYINGSSAVVHVTGALGIGAVSGANSSVSTRIDSGALTVDGTVTLGINNTTRWSVLDINGGSFTSTDAAGGVVLGGLYTSIVTPPPVLGGNVVMLVRGSGTVAKAQRIQFGQGSMAGRSYLNLTNGALYVGSGGLVLGSSAPSGTDVASGQFDAAIRLNGGTLGATADWSSTIPVSINGIGAAIVTGADEANIPHTVTLHGVVTGFSALTKNGAGTVLFTSPSSDYFGPTLIEAGKLGLSGRTSLPVTVNIGATLAPQGQFTVGDGAAIDGTLAIGYNAAGTPAVGSLISDAGAITLGASSALSLSGTGTLTEPAYVLVKASGGITGTFATVTGIPAGYTLDYAYDDDANEGTPPAIAITGGGIDPYAAWTASYSLAGPDALPSADPDGDGLVNQLEYAFVTSPVASDADDAYTLGRSGNFLTLTFDHPADASLTYEVEGSNNLTGAWGVVHTFAPFTTAGTQTYTDAAADLTVTPRRFLRLKVTPAP